MNKYYKCLQGESSAKREETVYNHQDSDQVRGRHVFFSKMCGSILPEYHTFFDRRCIRRASKVSLLRVGTGLYKNKRADTRRGHHWQMGERVNGSSRSEAHASA